MNFFETELQNIIQSKYPNAVYVGSACYVSLNDTLRAKIQFETRVSVDLYDTILITILNQTSGTIDKLKLYLSDLLSQKKTNNPNFPNGVKPHIWDNCGNINWYVYHPTANDYQIIGDAIDTYLNVFRTNLVQNSDKRTPVNNDRYKRIEPSVDAILIHTEDVNGTQLDAPMTDLRTTCIKIVFVDCQTELAHLTVPASVTDHDIHLALAGMNTRLFDTDVYDAEGLCANTLLAHLTENKSDWSYSVIKPDSEWLDTTIYPDS